MFEIANKYKQLIWLALGCSACIIFRLGLLASNSFPFNSDEAIVGLMARHILSGERPIFFYGQAYMGSLDAFLVAFVFKLIGVNVFGIRLVQLILYILVILTGYLLVGRSLKNATAVGMAVWLLALPNVNIVLYTTVSLGGYGEMLLIGNLVWLVLEKLHTSKEALSAIKYNFLVFLFGFLMGLGFWTHGLTLIYSIPAAIFWLVKYFTKRKNIIQIILPIAVLIIGGLVGSLPLWVYAYRNGVHALISEFLGSAVAVDQISLFQMIGERLFRYIVLGGTVIMGMRPPWAVQWLGLPLLPIILALSFLTAWYWLIEIKKRRDIPMLVWLSGSALLLLSAGFIFTSFGNDPSGRYFIPITIFGCFLFTGAISRTHLNPILKNGIVALIICFNVIGVIQCALINPPGLTTQFDQTTVIDHHYQTELVKFLEDKAELRGYTNYWISYPLAFLSDEKIIYTPVLPYHQDLRYTPRDNRYAPYNELTSTSDKVAYITSNTPLLDAYLRLKFNQAGITWQEIQIGDYKVFYGLSGIVRPVEIGLGVLR